MAAPDGLCARDCLLVGHCDTGRTGCCPDALSVGDGDFGAPLPCGMKLGRLVDHTGTGAAWGPEAGDSGGLESVLLAPDGVREYVSRVAGLSAVTITAGLEGGAAAPGL